MDDLNTNTQTKLVWIDCPVEDQFANKLARGQTATRY